MTTRMDNFDERVRFLTELARRLHIAGVSSARLEGAVRSVALSIGVSCEIWATPTGLLFSLGDTADQYSTQQTRVLRLDPGVIDLEALAALADISRSVSEGTQSVADAWEAMRALDRAPTRRQLLLVVFAFGLASAAVAGLLRTGWLDILVAWLLGLVVGWMAVITTNKPHFGAAFEAVAAFVVTVLATAFAHFIAPLTIQTVIIAALIILMPGLTLTTAVTELATHQLVTGTARFAGAMTTLMKLTFGSVAGAQLTLALNWTPEYALLPELPSWVEVLAALAAAGSFAILFKAAHRDVLLVMGSALLGYALTRLFGEWMGVPGSAFAGAVFFSSLITAALADLYGRFKHRPAALIRVPGIMLLVPGSVSFRALGFVVERDYALGLDTLVAVLSAVLALVVGLLFGALIVPPRRYY